MDGYLSMISWTPGSIGAGGLDAGFFLMVGMAFIGASIVTRIIKVDTSFNFSVNFMVMLAGCLVMQGFLGEALQTTSNGLIANAISANFGMTVAGFALLFGYRNAV